LTLCFGEIIRIFMNNLDLPLNLTNGPKGINAIDPIQIRYSLPNLESASTCGI
jgi:branched-chain amino acid transport system permease protein